MRCEPVEEEERHADTEWHDTGVSDNLVVLMENGDLILVHSTEQERWRYGKHTFRNPLYHFMERCDRYMQKAAPVLVNFESVDSPKEQLINIRNIQHVDYFEGGI